MTRRSVLVATLAAAALAFVAVSGASAAECGAPTTRRGADAGSSRDLQLGVGQSVVCDLPEEAAEIYVGDPRVAGAVVRSARRIYLSALANGETSVFAFAGNGRKIETIEILVKDSVVRDQRDLKALLDAAMPGNAIQVKTVERSVILLGAVETALDAQKAVDIARGFVDDDVQSGSTTQESSSAQSGHVSSLNGSATRASQSITSQSGESVGSKHVINSLVIRELDQVTLRVTVAEVRRDIVKQLGVSMSGSGPNGSFQFDNPFAINGALTSTGATLSWTKGASTLTANLQAFERQGVAHTLAEPNVTAVSGESAKFMAGGTIPIAQSESCGNGGTNANGCTIGFVQQPYGVTLNFTPVVVSAGRIQLRIATEVTDIDYSTQITIPVGNNANLNIPGFRTRNNVTTVELPSGGSIATAGLISTQTQQAINGVPGLMNLPILGALFRSRDYQRNETELMIVVTPYIVHAIDPSQVVKPDQNFQDASDPQAWLLGRVNRLYSTAGALQPLPGYAGKIGFITQ